MEGGGVSYINISVKIVKDFVHFKLYALDIFLLFYKVRWVKAVV